MTNLAVIARAAALCGLAAILVAGGPAGRAAAADSAGQQDSGGLGQLKGKFGDWELRCETPAGAPKEQCALLQSLAAEDRPNVNLMVITLKTADKKNRLLRVNAPLGVLLPNGLGLQIDQTDIGRAGFVRCLPTGCVAEGIMDDKSLD